MSFSSKSLQKELDALNGQIEALSGKLNDCFNVVSINKAIIDSNNLLYQAQKVYMSVRNYVSSLNKATNAKSDYIGTITKEVLSISLTDNGWLRLDYKVPLLRHEQVDMFLKATTAHILQEMREADILPFFEKSYVVVENAVKSKKRLDPDNINLIPIMNSLKGYVIPDDDVKYCSILITSHELEQEEPIIYVLPESQIDLYFKIKN